MIVLLTPVTFLLKKVTLLINKVILLIKHVTCLIKQNTFSILVPHKETANIHTTHKARTKVPMGVAREARRPIGTFVHAREARAPLYVV